MNRLIARKRHHLVIILLLIGCSAFLMSEEKVKPAAYDLKIKIEPAQGTIAVHGTVDVPLQDRPAKEFRFALHDTFVVNKMLVDGKEAKFSLSPLRRTIRKSRCGGRAWTLRSTTRNCRRHLLTVKSGKSPMWFSSSQTS